MNGHPVVETRALSVSVPSRGGLPFMKRPGLDILVDVSLAIQPGEIVCMVGESGSGKSTFGKTLLGLMKPSSGDLLLDGEKLPDHSTRSFARLREAAALAKQPEEKRVLLALAPRYPVQESLDFARKFVDDPQVAAEAKTAVTRLERSVRR